MKNVTEIDARDQYREMLFEFPTLAIKAWKHKENAPCIYTLENMNGASPGEKLLGKVFASIWKGSGDKIEIDFTDLAALGEKERAIIATFLISPFWP